MCKEYWPLLCPFGKVERPQSNVLRYEQLQGGQSYHKKEITKRKDEIIRTFDSIFFLASSRPMISTFGWK